MLAMRVAALLLATLAPLGACRSDSGGGSRTVDILALGGDQPEPGAGIISYGRDGSVIDRSVADIVGRAIIGVDDDSLIAVVFPGSLSSTTPVISVVTTTAPPSETPLTIHGPNRSAAPGLIVGALEIDAPNLPAATYFLIDVGCATVRITKFPEFIDIGACSMGSDTSLDVLARGYHDGAGTPPSPVFDGYAAGRAKMVDGHAILDLPAWQTSGTPISVSAAGTTVTWTLLVDGVPFAEDEPIVGDAFAYANLAVDTTVIALARPAAAGARLTQQYVSGLPTSISATDADFLPAFDATTELAGTDPAAFRWAADTTTFDAVHLHATWGGTSAFIVPGTSRVAWDAVLPPDASGVTLPALDDDLGAMLAGAEGITQADIYLRHLDSSGLADFSALQAAGLHVEETLQESTIVPRPANGSVRIAYTLGTR
jgi:hypothetical protein